jgi:thiamine kinase-like enzyme
VLKSCKSKAAFQRELAVYSNDLSITPRLISADFPILKISYLPTIPIGEMEHPDFKKIARLYSILHTQTIFRTKCLCHIDCNPKNILYSKTDEQYYLVDFSDSKYDFPEKDIINFLLFWAAIFSDSEFENCYTDFLTAYNLNAVINKERFLILLPECIKAFQERRKKFKKTERSQYHYDIMNLAYMENQVNMDKKNN